MCNHFALYFCTSNRGSYSGKFLKLPFILLFLLNLKNDQTDSYSFSVSYDVHVPVDLEIKFNVENDRTKDTGIIEATEWLKLDSN